MKREITPPAGLRRMVSGAAGPAAPAAVAQRKADEDLRASSVTVSDALLQVPASQFDANKDVAEREVEISDKAAESFAEGIVQSIRAGELDLPADASDAMRKKIRVLKAELANMNDDELRSRVSKDVAAFGGDDTDGITDENNLVLKYLLARDALEKITDEKEISEIETAYKHVKGGYSKRVFYKMRLGLGVGQGVNVLTAGVDIPAVTAALIATGPVGIAAVALGGVAAEMFAKKHSVPVRVAMGVAAAAVAGVSFAAPAVMAPIVATGVIARTAVMKAQTKSLADMSPVGVMGRDDKGALMFSPRIKAKGAVYLLLGAAVGLTATNQFVKTLQNSGAAQEIAAVAKANTDKSLGQIRKARDEIKKAPAAFRAAAHTAYEQALTLGGTGHGPRTVRTVAIYFGDRVVNKDGTLGVSNREAFLAQNPGREADFTAIEAQVKAKLAEMGVRDTSRGLLGHIEDRLKLLTLVDKASTQKEIAELLKENITFIDIRDAERRADRVSDSAEAIGNVTPYDELMAGFYKAFKTISKDPAQIQVWMSSLKYIFEDHSADIGALEGLDALKQEALFGLQKVLAAITVEEDLRTFVKRVRDSGVSLVDGGNVPVRAAQPVQQTSPLVALQAQETVLVQKIAKEKNAAAKKRLEADLSALRVKIAALPTDASVASPVQLVKGKVDVLEAFTIPSLNLDKILTPKIVESLAIRFEGGLKEVVSQDFFSRIGSVIWSGLSPEMKKYTVRGLAKTSLPMVGLTNKLPFVGMRIPLSVLPDPKFVTINLDEKDPHVEAQIQRFLGIAVFALFFLAPIMIGGTRDFRRWRTNVWHRKDDEMLADGEKNIAKDLLAHIRLREKAITDRLLHEGVSVDPAQTESEINEQAIANLIRKHIVREMDPDDERLSLFVARGEQLRDQSERKAYGERLDALQKLVQEKKYEEVLAVLLPDQGRVEARIRDKLELLRYSVPVAREGIITAVKNGLRDLMDPVRAESIIALHGEIAKSDAVLGALRTTLARSAGITQDSILCEEYLRVEMLRRAMLGIEYNTFTDGKLGMKSTEALDANLLSIDDADVQKSISAFVQSQQLRNEWRSGSGLTIEEAHTETQKFWDSIVMGNSKRLQDACARALKGMPLQGEINLQRAYLASTGEPTISFAMKLVDGTDQRITFNRAIPSVGLDTTENVVLEVEKWLAKGGTVSLDLQLAVDALSQKKESLVRSVVIAGVARSGDVISVPHSVLVNGDYQKQLQELVTISSAVALQKTVLASLELSKGAPTALQEKVLRDPVGSNLPGVFKDELSQYVGIDSGVEYRIDLTTGRIQQEKGGKVISEDKLFKA